MYFGDEEASGIVSRFEWGRGRGHGVVPEDGAEEEMEEGGRC